MRAKGFRRLSAPGFLVAALAVSLLVLNSTTTAGPAAAEPTIHCRVIEAMAGAQFHVRLAVFHYRDAADRARLSELLRKYDGDAVQFQTSDGVWRTATLLRLKTCFGRGLLVFSTLEPALAKKQEFVLRFPISSVK